MIRIKLCQNHLCPPFEFHVIAHGAWRGPIHHHPRSTWTSSPTGSSTARPRPMLMFWRDTPIRKFCTIIEIRLTAYLSLKMRAAASFLGCGNPKNGLEIKTKVPISTRLHQGSPHSDHNPSFEDVSRSSDLPVRLRPHKCAPAVYPALHRDRATG